jgi:hypothetical protein
MWVGLALLAAQADPVTEFMDDIARGARGAKDQGLLAAGSPDRRFDVALEKAMIAHRAAIFR